VYNKSSIYSQTKDTQTKPNHWPHRWLLEQLMLYVTNVTTYGIL